MALDVGDGRELWRVPLPHPERPEDEPRESPLSTPTAIGERVFAIHPSGLLFALDAADGSHLWSHDLAREFGAVPPSYGMSTSPVLVDGRLFVLAGGREGHNLIAFDPATGEVLTSGGPATQGSYATPVIGVVAGKRQLVVPAANSLYAVGSDGGDALWSHAGLPYPDRAPLLLEAGHVFIPFQEFGAMLEVTESGDVRELWRSEGLRNSYSPAVHHAGAIYGFGGPRLMCLDVASGETLWQHRLGEGSLVRVDDHLIVSSSMGGGLTLVAASPDGYREKAALEVFPSGGSSFTPPSFGAGRIFLRGAKEIAAIRLGR
ncbi:MAG: PQQ-like beta-propeller repeat protein [Gemmatimonadota bacterium]|nr:PQQ-like beta-propeller repeat protein [Gemmatimonadota bacterium]